MKFNLKLVAGLCVAVLVLGLGIIVYRQTRPSVAITADAAETLSATQAEDGGTEPVALPTTPVLKNTSGDPHQVAIDFGYKVGPTSYAYRLSAAFAPDAEQGTMDLGTPRGTSTDLEQFSVNRRWSDTRKAYMIAVSQDLTKISPAVPSLCVRAVIGPNKTNLDLQDASLCVMQRDQDGRCHPTTLACGVIR